MRLREFRPEDAEVLADISRRAFESDTRVGAGSPGGPPGYDSPEWQSRMAAEAESYLVVESEDGIVGGMIVFGTDGDYWLGRMYIDPERQGRGLGSEALARLEATRPDWTRWRLETPPWNRRTQEFYRKAGYEPVGRSPSGDVLFEKRARRET
jgi:GNAT superfamily N-acetyltransferase